MFFFGAKDWQKLKEERMNGLLLHKYLNIVGD